MSGIGLAIAIGIPFDQTQGTGGSIDLTYQFQDGVDIDFQDGGTYDFN